MKTKLILLLIFVPVIAFGQKQENFNKLIDKLNHCLLEYDKLTAFGSFDNYYPINDFGLSKQEIKELIADADSDEILSANKDSIQEYQMILFFQGDIVRYIDKIIKHPDFLKYDITNLLKGDVLSIVKSDDNKLFNISFDEKTGGSYRSQISKMYYIDTSGKVVDLNETDNSIFASDGYGAIYTIETEEGTKYVLTGFVRDCSFCFKTFVQLLKFEENKFIEEFMYSVNSRSWEEGVEYDHEGKAIYVDYHIDDLTPFCYCGGDPFDKEKWNYDRSDENQKRINCKCKFIFDGNNFELVEESWKVINEKTAYEIVDDKFIAPNQKSTLKHGIYLFAIMQDDFLYIDIIDESNAEFFSLTFVGQMKYLICGSKLHLIKIKSGEYFTFEIKNDDTIQWLDIEEKEVVFKWTSYEEFDEIIRQMIVGELEEEDENDVH
ncbi:MAG: hypothetical protein FWC41_07095 [Firmicutes bacterium]|nr:hypothetical protein [Bacillota bacterium]